jgi:hypothetical protein
MGQMPAAETSYRILALHYKSVADIEDLKQLMPAH